MTRCTVANMIRVVVKSQSRQLQAQRPSRLEAAAGFVNEVGEDRGEERHQNIIINSPGHKLVRDGMHGGCGCRCDSVAEGGRT